jgi:predicted nucleic acid-binding protein
LNGCVVDASVALKWVLDEAGSAAASDLLDGRNLFAPPLLATEAANALWVVARRGQITGAEAEDALDLILRAPFQPSPSGLNLPLRALELARLLDHPVYDCTYLALAIAVERPVITADRRFAAAAGRSAEAAPFVKLLPVEEH